MKTFFFDVETTGLDVAVHGIVQLSGVIEIDDNPVDEFNFFVQPPPKTMVSPQALAVNKLTIDQIKTFDDYPTTWNKLTTIMNKYVNKFDPMDKFYPAGYNVGFDYPFLQKMAKIAGDNYFGAYFNHHLIDPFAIVRWLDYTKRIKIANHKLETVCKYYSIPIVAHDALSDIKATCILTKTFKEALFVRNKL